MSFMLIMTMTVMMTIAMPYFRMYKLKVEILLFSVYNWSKKPLPFCFNADNRLFCFDRQTGRPYHNFISWQDMRSHTYVESWNKSLTLKVNLAISLAFFALNLYLQ